MSIIYTHFIDEIDMLIQMIQFASIGIISAIFGTISRFGKPRDLQNIWDRLGAGMFFASSSISLVMISAIGTTTDIHDEEFIDLIEWGSTGTLILFLFGFLIPIFSYLMGCGTSKYYHNA
jgi:hypothetical protein